MQFEVSADPHQPAQADLGSCPITESMVATVYVDVERMLRSDFAGAHAVLDLPCSHKT